MPQKSADSDASNRSRALLTDTEREILQDYPNVDMNHHSSIVSRIRERLTELETDIRILQDHHALGDELPDDL